MEKHRLKKNQRVKLKSDGQDYPYKWAGAGSEGWVRRLDTDNVGFPVVYIEWDKDHWAFNGEPDQWTLEDHFDPVEEIMPENSEDLVKAFAEFVASREQGEGSSSSTKDTRYAEAFAQGKKFALNAEAFLLIAVEVDRKDADAPVFNPMVFQSYKDDEAGLILESQLSVLSSNAFQQLAVEQIRRNRGKS